MFKRIIAVAAIVFSLGCARSKEGDSLASPLGKVGVYDSRSVAIAYCGSAKFEEDLRNEQAAGGLKAKSAMLNRQRMMHKQGFGKAPVDDILAKYPDEVRAVCEKRGVARIVSKWDKKALKSIAEENRVDVTADLIEVPGPSERQRRSAIEIQKYKPTRLWPHE